MTFYPQCRITRIGAHRLHGRLNNMLIMLEAVTTASLYLISGIAKATDGEFARLSCRQLPIDIKMPVVGPLSVALANGFPDEIRIECGPQQFPIPNPWAAGFGKSSPTSFGVAAALANLVAPYFVEYYEAYNQFIYDKYRSADKFPPLWRFARVVRNGISHGMKVSIVRENESPVSWYGITYSHKHNGRPLLGVSGADMVIGDVLILMFEMSDLLDEEACPI